MAVACGSGLKGTSFKPEPKRRFGESTCSFNWPAPRCGHLCLVPCSHIDSFNCVRKEPDYSIFQPQFSFETELI